MVTKIKKNESSKYSIYLISIVAIVAIVGIISLSANRSVSTIDESGISIEKENIGGEAKSRGTITSAKEESKFNFVPVPNPSPEADLKPEEIEKIKEINFPDIVMPESIHILDDMSELEVTRFNLTTAGVLTQAYLDEHYNESIGFNFSGNVLLNDDLTFTNTIALFNDDYANPLTLNCQGHSITFDLEDAGEIAIWVKNNNNIIDCNIIADFSIGFAGSWNLRAGIVLNDDSQANDCFVTSLCSMENNYNFRVNFLVDDESTVMDSNSENGYIGFLMQNHGSAVNCHASENSRGFDLYDNSNADYCYSENNYQGFISQQYSNINNSISTGNNYGFQVSGQNTAVFNSYAYNSTSNINSYGFTLMNSGTAMNCYAENNLNGFKISSYSNAYNCEAINNVNGFKMSLTSNAHDCEATENEIGFYMIQSSEAHECSSSNNDYGFKMFDNSKVEDSYAFYNDYSGIYIPSDSNAEITNVEVYGNGFYNSNTGSGSAGIEVEQTGNFENPTITAQFNNVYVHNNAIGGFIGGNIDTNNTFCNNDYYDLIEYGISYTGFPLIQADNIITINYDGSRNIIPC